MYFSLFKIDIYLKLFCFFVQIGIFHLRTNVCRRCPPAPPGFWSHLCILYTEYTAAGNETGLCAFLWPAEQTLPALRCRERIHWVQTLSGIPNPNIKGKLSTSVTRLNLDFGRWHKFVLPLQNRKKNMLQQNYFLIQKRYGHVTEQMKTESANRMEAFIQSVSA